MSAEALSSFELKWAVAHPELALALRYAQPLLRAPLSALACLSHELAHAAFHIVEPEVATTKLQWWAGELTTLAAGDARHPLCEVLLRHAPVRQLPAGAWTALIAGALAQRDAAPASGMTDLLDRYRGFHLPLAVIEASLHSKLDIEASAQAATLSRAVQETLRLNEALASDRLPLPLDLLARHQLSRSEIEHPGKQRDAVLREHFAALAEMMRTTSQRGLSPMVALGLHVDRYRSRRAAGASDPLAEAGRNLDRLPLSSAWIGWRAARRMQSVG
ncbi:MAG TPA: squalene/phytoene synthase family protein [Dokdonella sp.]|uniref:squalene/phytoene synthase family protein n=1 Tax=Dokdonella sp. TaxID=2291710 RepID=UPI002C644508|nr:squalene/phytoene synthase family protein [Dokdonella sp.]HOX71943.1 squalene/phytoene synthase family protein [Dokdonella sp.]HPG94606.1 squalene/phytoene synthase family protein [Dokdonella sp.]HPN80124.1 squalene/phytoene synthase family protein [Dokdonella sp.]